MTINCSPTDANFSSAFIFHNLADEIAGYLNDSDLISVAQAARPMNRWFNHAVTMRRQAHFSAKYTHLELVRAQDALRHLERITVLQGPGLLNTLKENAALLEQITSINLCGRLPHEIRAQCDALVYLVKQAPKLRELAYSADEMHAQAKSVLQGEALLASRTIELIPNTQKEIGDNIAQAFKGLLKAALEIKTDFEVCHQKITRYKDWTENAKSMLTALAPNIAMVAFYRPRTQTSDLIAQGAMILFGLSMAGLLFMANYLEKQHTVLIKNKLGERLKTFSDANRTYENRLGDLRLTKQTRQQHIEDRLRDLATERRNLLADISDHARALKGESRDQVPQQRALDGSVIPPLNIGDYDRHRELTIRLEKLRSQMDENEDQQDIKALLHAEIDILRQLRILEQSIERKITHMSQATELLNENVSQQALFKTERTVLYGPNNDPLFEL